MSRAFLVGERLHLVFTRCVVILFVSLVLLWGASSLLCGSLFLLCGDLVLIYDESLLWCSASVLCDTYIVFERIEIISLYSLLIWFTMILALAIGELPHLVLLISCGWVICGVSAIYIYLFLIHILIFVISSYGQISGKVCTFGISWCLTVLYTMYAHTSFSTITMCINPQLFYFYHPLILGFILGIFGGLIWLWYVA